MDEGKKGLNPAYYAHSTESKNKDDWQPLEQHLMHVADLAQVFASVFRAGKWGELSGLLHDAGKASDAFQRRLEGQPIRVDHSTFGARLAGQKVGRLGLIMAYAIAGQFPRPRNCLSSSRDALMSTLPKRPVTPAPLP
jgi:hypothetical protein